MGLVKSNCCELPTSFFRDSIDDEASDIIKYDEEGPGEEDTDAYDPRLLQKPVNGLGGNMNAGMNGGLNGHGPPLDESLQQTYAPTKRKHHTFDSC